MSGSLKYWIRIAGDHAVVAKAIADAHDENTSMLAYNNENSLNCVIAIAYFSAGKDCLKIGRASSRERVLAGV